VNLARIVIVALWLFVGHATLGGLYWGFLNVPESNVLMLIASALLALLLVVGAGIVKTTGLLWLRTDWTFRAALHRSIRALPAFLAALALWLVVRWICHRLLRYHEAHSGELDAWLIATFDWTRTTWLHRTIDYILHFVQFVIGTSLAVTLLATAAIGSLADAVHPRWMRRALSPLQLAIIAVAFYGLILLPWQAVYWRPASLPATAVEIAFALTKLTILGLIMHLGWTFILWAPQRSPRQERAVPVAAE
jgi:hypothetical protein